MFKPKALSVQFVFTNLKEIAKTTGSKVSPIAPFRSSLTKGGPSRKTKKLESSEN